MPSKEDHKKRLLPLLENRITSEIKSVVGNVEHLIDKMAHVLSELEKHEESAAQLLKDYKEKRKTEAKEFENTLALQLYYLHNPPEELKKLIDGDPILKFIFDALREIAPKSKFNEDSLAEFEKSFPKDEYVVCGGMGEIFGFGPYESFDATAGIYVLNFLLNFLPRSQSKGHGIAKFVTKDWSTPLPLQANDSDAVRIAIIGDWGAGRYKLEGCTNPDGPAVEVLDTLAALADPPDYVIHLGDTYWAGTGPNSPPPNEEADNLVNIWKQYPSLSRDGRCFTLNSNHEMYGGAWGYYDQALNQSMFSAQQGCSYFALEFGDWIIAGIDSAYFDPSFLYLFGGLGDDSKNPQYAFLKDLSNTGKKVIIMTHHAGLSVDGKKTTKLWDEVNGCLAPAYWYWGHIHLGIVYNAQAASGPTKTRCLGHSSIPFAIPPDLENSRNVDWYSNTPLVPGAPAQEFFHLSPRATNGFAVITLTKDGISEQIYNMGDKTPVWTS